MNRALTGVSTPTGTPCAAPQRPVKLDDVTAEEPPPQQRTGALPDVNIGTGELPALDATVAHPRIPGAPTEPPADPAAVLLPDRWPSAWPHRYPPVANRAVFVLSTMVLTWVGLIFVGEPANQWWAIVLPVVLLAGPVIRLGRTPDVLSRAVRSGRVRSLQVRVLDGRRAVARDGTAIGLCPGPATAQVAARAGEPALLLWTRSARPRAALVFADAGLAYLARPPAGARRDGLLPEYGEAGWTLKP